MKKIVNTFLILLLFLTQGSHVYAASWDTNAKESDGIMIPGNGWKDKIKISKVLSTGAYDPKDGSNMANLVLYCSDPCKVTTLDDADVSLGGYMCKVTISSKGKPVHGKSVSPTYKNEVYSEDFDAYINGKGTYWNLSEGIYYMESVNRSHCLYLVVGDPLKENHVHTYRDAKTVQPTCKEKGYTLRECTGCDAMERYNYTDKLPHDYNIKVIEASCEKDGKTQSTCKNCGYVKNDNVTEAYGHLWKKGNVNYKGKVVYTCERCSEKMEKSITEVVLTCEHKLVYSVGEEGTIVQKCEKPGCDHESSVTVSQGSTVFTGKELDASITYDEDWYGQKVKVEYYNRKGPGIMNVTISMGDVSTKISYRIVANVPVDLSKYIESKKSNGATLKNSQYMSDDISKLNIQNAVESMTYVSLHNAGEAQKKIIQQRIIDLLTKATYRPIQYGGKKSDLVNFPFQNDGKYGVTGRKVFDKGLNTTVVWQSAAQGCAAYSRFFSAYVYGTDGVFYDVWGYTGSRGKYTTFKASSGKQARDQMRTIVDPGETIQYEGSAPHKIVFLGESADGKGFYFVSYGGGKYYSNNYWQIEVRYVTFDGFVGMTNGTYIIRDANGTPAKKSNTPGSYYEGDAKSVKISKDNQATLVANCPVEMVVSMNNETLDSRLLADGHSKTVSFGIMKVKGDIGKDRQITLEVNDSFLKGEYDLTILGTAEGSMDLTLQLTSIDENGIEITNERQFLDVPVSATSNAKMEIADAYSDVYLYNTYNNNQETYDLWIASPCTDEQYSMYQVVSKPSEMNIVLTSEYIDVLEAGNETSHNHTVLVVVGAALLSAGMGVLVVSKKKSHKKHV